MRDVKGRCGWGDVNGRWEEVRWSGGGVRKEGNCFIDGWYLWLTVLQDDCL